MNGNVAAVSLLFFTFYAVCQLRNDLAVELVIAPTPLQYREKDKRAHCPFS